MSRPYLSTGRRSAARRMLPIGGHEVARVGRPAPTAAFQPGVGGELFGV